MGKFESEDSLIIAIKQGDPYAFRVLMKKYFKPLANFANYYVTSTSDAKDIVQDVFANIWESRHTWHPSHSVKMYLFQAVKNEAIKMLRDRKTEQKYVRQFILEKGDQEETGNDKEELSRFESEVQKAIEELPDRARLIYKLHRRDGLTYKEIAEVMQISHKTVESQMSRALKKLRNRLAPYLPILLLVLPISSQLLS